MSDGQIQLVLIVDIQYPDMKKVSLSVMMAGDPGSGWVQHSEIFYHGSFLQPPGGQVDLYLSDFLGQTGLPAALCRPSATELAAGISRFVYSSIFVTFELPNLTMC